MSLLTRLLLLVVIASLPGLAIHVYNEHDLRQTREAQVYAEVLRDAQAINDELARVIEGARNVLATVAQASAVRERNWTACNRFLKRLGDVYPAYSLVFIVDRDARIGCASEPEQAGAVLGNPAYLRAMLESGSFVIGTYHVGPTSSGAVLPMLMPVRDDAGQIVAGAAIGLRLDWLSGHLARKPIPTGNAYLIVDRDGTILARSDDPERWSGEPVGPFARPYMQAARAGSTTAIWRDGVKRVTAYIPPTLAPEGLLVMASRDAEAALWPVQAAMLRGLAVSGTASVLVLLGLFLGGRYFLERPIRRLIAAADALRQGRYGEEEPFLLEDRSEFGRLGAAFKAMAGALAVRETALRDSEAEYRAIFEMAGRGKALTDPKTSRFLRVNRALCEMTGYSAEELCRRTVRDITHPDDHEADRRARTRLFSGEDPVYEREKRYIRKDGTVIWVLVNVVLIRDAEGRPEHTVAVIEDVTARKQAEERLKLLAAEVDHRAKNMLALVQIMLRQTRAATVQQYAAAAQGRVRLDGPPLALRPNAAQSLAMAFHELATNAAKYGALASSEGRVEVVWSLGPEGLVLRWTESGGLPVRPVAHKGLGLNVIERAVREQLEGEVHIEWCAEGLVCRLSVPAGMLTLG